VGCRPPPAHWSPSRLEAIGACPQRFFFRHMLRVDELDEAMEGYEIDRLEIGLGIHAVLRDVFAAVVEAGLPLRPENETRAVDLALRTTRRAVETRTGRIVARMRHYPLLRETLLATWRDSLERLVRAEVTALCAGEATILGVEHAATTTLHLGGRGDPVTVQGRFDRADARGRDAIVITDYKTGGSDLETHVDTAAMLKGSRLQMPVYVLMAEALRKVWQRPRARVTAEVLGAGPAFDRADAFPVRASIDPEKSRRIAPVSGDPGGSVDLARGGLYPSTARTPATAATVLIASLPPPASAHRRPPRGRPADRGSPPPARQEHPGAVARGRRPARRAGRDREAPMSRPVSGGPLPDAGDRRRAATVFDRNLVVTAGAGTGKTALLVERALNLIGSGRARIDQMAVITFTEKAAAELRLRLAVGLDHLRALTAGQTPGEPAGEAIRARDFLLGEAGQTPDEVAGGPAGAVETDAAAVTTIHRSAPRSRRYPVEAGADAAFQIDDGLAADRL
jgi:ATP-dependent exoDNAse (exonuclease V) beta subunit